MLAPEPEISTPATAAVVFIYGCRGFDGVAAADDVGEGVEASQPLSGELGNTTFSGRAKCADWGVIGYSTDELDANSRLCN